MAQTPEPAGKDMLIGEVYDLTPARITAFLKALREATEARDFVEMGILSICPEHHQSRRKEAIADLLRCSPKTGERISKHEGDYAKAWPLLMAGFLPFMSLRGTIEAIHAATGIEREDAERLLARCLGARS